MMRKLHYGSARRTARWRVLTRRYLNRIADSRGLYHSMRKITNLSVVAGLVLLTWGFFASVSTFQADAATLIDFAGADGAVSASAAYIQDEALRLLGFGGTLEDASLPPELTRRGAVKTPTVADGQGFIPYQVALDRYRSQRAPALSGVPATGRLASNGPTATPVLMTATAPPQPPEQAPVETASPPPPPAPEPALTAAPAVPGWLVIPKINLEAPVVVADLQTVMVGGQEFEQWQAPNMFAAGWQQGSAMLGEPGNTVFNGHHNIYGEVFAHLRDLEQGDEIIVYSGEQPFHYVVSQVMKLSERDVSLEQRQENAQWVLPSDDERLTLVTCWPPTSNTHRLIVVAVPSR